MAKRLRDFEKSFKCGCGTIVPDIAKIRLIW